MTDSNARSAASRSVKRRSVSGTGASAGGGGVPSRSAGDGSPCDGHASSCAATAS
ncbi:hypothetical protein ACRAWB_08585 [Leifsonia poae]|uniref:hypothetical protein n=1 Tax=Leifsonia poae TaxID=110933 RepID=UPI003D68380C